MQTTPSPMFTSDEQRERVRRSLADLAKQPQLKPGEVPPEWQAKLTRCRLYPRDAAENV